MTAISFPGLPASGGALSSYFDQMGPGSIWVPGAGETAEKIRTAIDEYNDPSAWLALAASSLRIGWQSLPPDVRDQAMNALKDLIDDGLDRFGAYAGDMAGAVSSGVGDALPIIGQIVKALIDLVVMFVKAKKITEGHREDIAKINHVAAQFDTLFHYDKPQDWVFRQMKLRNFLDHVSGKEWRDRPAWNRSSSGAASSWFTSAKQIPDTGSCTKGERWKCTGTYAPFDCDLDSDGKTGPCVRYMNISALFFPYWSPVYPAGPIPNVSGDDRDPSAVLIARQFALLSIPDANLRVDLLKAQIMARRFHASFMAAAEKYYLSEVGSDGIAEPTLPADRLRVVESEIPDFKPISSERRHFFVGEDDLIQVHQGASASADSWGVPAPAGPDTPKNLMVTVAQHNTVIGNVLALTAARAAMLRQGPIMYALRHDNGLSAYDPRARAAINYAASYGKEIPPPVAAPDFVLSAKRAISSGGGGAGALVVGAGIAALLLARGRR